MFTMIKYLPKSFFSCLLAHCPVMQYQQGFEYAICILAYCGALATSLPIIFSFLVGFPYVLYNRVYLFIDAAL
jgi:hypothetical protein